VSMDGRGRAARVTRFATAVIAAGMIAAVCFLIIVQEAERRGHTALDFNHTLGNIVQGEETGDQTTRAALGVIGDSAAPTGLLSALGLGVVVMLVYALAVVPLVRAGWIVRGLVLGAVTFLAVGLAYPPLAASHLEEDLGAFGTGYGRGTVTALLLASLVFGIVGARCHALIASAGWWTPRGEVLGESLQDVDMGEPREPSLELTE
jgi:hypothetical protein